MTEPNPAALTSMVVWGAFALAFLFGAVGNKTHFCTMGAVSDVVNMGDWNRMRMWLLAIAIATAGASGLQLAGLVDLSKSIYTTPRVAW
ncbi:MAG TPA: YeeE/YedE thiosulfate transporter family protein, partial [Burkholderiales bacterium]